jgi:hypothetical protein
MTTARLRLISAIDVFGELLSDRAFVELRMQSPQCLLKESEPTGRRFAIALFGGICDRACFVKCDRFFGFLGIALSSRETLDDMLKGGALKLIRGWVQCKLTILVLLPASCLCWFPQFSC